MGDVAVEAISQFSFEEMFTGIIGMIEPVLDFLGLSADEESVQRYLKISTYGIKIVIVGFLVLKLFLTLVGGTTVRVLEKRVSIDVAITVLKIGFYIAMIYWTIQKKPRRCLRYEDDVI